MRPLIVCAALMSSGLALSGCATLPAKQAGAFNALAAADRDAFQALATQENAALTDFAKGYLQRNPTAKVETRDCDVSSVIPAPAAPPAPCKVVLLPARPPGLPAAVVVEPISITVAAPETRALIASLADYGATMAELAEAKDVEAAQAATTKVGTSVKGLIAIVPGAPALLGAVVDLAVWAGNQSFKEKRRKALYEAALNADGAVEKASEAMGAIALRLRSNLEFAAKAKLVAAEEAYSLTPNDQTFTALVTATAEMNAARAVRTDYSALSKGHKALVQALKNDADPVVALGQLETFLGLLNAARTAAAKDEDAG